MAYTPKTWQCGETIMADDLNHMEQGIAQGGSVAPLIVHEQVMTAAEMAEAGLTGVLAGNAYRLDTEYGVIEAAYNSGRPVYLDKTESAGGSTKHVIGSLVLVAQVDENHQCLFATGVGGASGSEVLVSGLGYGTPNSSYDYGIRVVTNQPPIS